MKLSGIRNFFSMYVDGFRSMTIGKSLWLIIIIKLVVLFAILRVFFFPDLLRQNYDTDSERAQAVRSTLSSGR